MSHHCHATNCSKKVPPNLFMCRRHWYTLPEEMRKLIWATYRPGQEDDKSPSRDYCIIAKTCVEYIAKQEGVKADTQLYDMLLRHL